MSKEYQNSEGIAAANWEAQRAARDAIMEIPQFPHLERKLIGAIRNTTAAIVMHQLVYWFSKPKMQDRWTLYKTFTEWKEERGLGRKSIDGARRRLGNLELVEEKHGPNKRVHYRVDWVKLAELLDVDYELDEDLEDDFDIPFEDEKESLSPQGYSDPEQNGDKHDALEGDSLSPQGCNESLYPQGYRGDCTLKGTVVNAPLRVQSNTGTYAGAYSDAYSSVELSLQRGAEPAKAEPAPLINKDKNPNQDTTELPGKDKRHSPNGDSPDRTTAAMESIDREERKDRRFIRAVLEEPTEELEAALKRYRDGEIDVSFLAGTMRHKPYLAGSQAWSKLRPEQVATVLAEMEAEQVEEQVAV